ncbi:MAG TPA: hypothetical protein VF708_13905 [Pyrinomonadaceae bacterium]
MEKASNAYNFSSEENGRETSSGYQETVSNHYARNVTAKKDKMEGKSQDLSVVSSPLSVVSLPVLES